MKPQLLILLGHLNAQPNTGAFKLRQDKITSTYYLDYCNECGCEVYYSGSVNEVWAAMVDLLRKS